METMCHSRYTPDQALDALKIKSLCCRCALMSPVRVYHDMECAKSVAGQLDPKDTQPDSVKIFPEDPKAGGNKYQGLSSTAIPLQASQTNPRTSEEQKLDEPHVVGVPVIKENRSIMT